MANLFNRIRISFKLPAIMVALTMTAIAVMGVIAFLDARRQVLHDAEERLAGIGSARVDLLEAYGTSVEKELRFVSGLQLTAQAVSDLASAFGTLKTPTEELQTLFIAENPFEPGERDQLESPDGSGMYGWSHVRFHQTFRDFQAQNALHDVFLVDPNGNVVYSVEKEDDFATNLIEGPFAETGLGEVFRAALDAGTEGGVAFADFETYGGSGIAGAFAAHPILSNGEVVGVLGVQLSIEPLNAIFQDATGISASGETFLVGPDHLLRTDSVHSEEPSLLREERRSPAVDAAFGGETGIVETIDEEGRSALAFATPVDFFGVTWAAVAEELEAELMRPAVEMRNMFLFQGGIMLAVAALISILLSRSIALPLARVGEAMRRVAENDYSVAVPGKDRGDEIGGIARHLDAFRAALGESEALAREAAFKSAAFDNTSVPMMMTDENFTIIYLNDAMRRFFGGNLAEFRKPFPDFDPATLIGRSMDLFHRNAAHQRKMMDGSSDMPPSVQIAIGDLMIRLAVASVRDAAGKRIGMVLEWSDQTQTLRNAAILKTLDISQARVEFAPDGTVLDANDIFAAGVGTSVAALKGRQIRDIVRNGDGEAFWAQVGEGRSVIGRFFVKASEGHELIVDGGVNPVLDVKGKVKLFVMMATDVTEAQQAIAAAERQRKAQAAAQAEVVEALRVGLGRLSDGDLETTIETAFGAEYEQLRSDFNGAIVTLRGAMRGVVETAHQIRGESKEISTAAEDLSARAETQAATLEETAAALDELTASVKSAAEGASRAAEVVASARANAEASGEVVSEAVEAMSQIETSSGQISKIISVIEDIAFQTNLLALNAGVEAARAGDAGRGFAVVASEVRALAQRSSDAAREINGLISASGGHVKRGVDLVGQAGRALQSIFDSVTDIADHVSNIATSAQEQSRGLAEINVAVNQLDQVTQQNVAMFEETTAASHALNREAEALTSTVGRFRTGAEDAPAKAATAAKPAAVRRPAAAVKPVRPVKVVPPAPAPHTKKARAAAAVALADAAPADEGWAEF